MKNEKSFGFHPASLTALFILGNSVIIFPQKNANEYSFLAYIISAIAAVVIYILFSPLVRKLFLNQQGKNLKPYKKILLLILYLAVAALSLSVATETFIDFSYFGFKVILNDLTPILSFLCFFAVILFFAFKRQENFLKFCFLAFFFIAAVIVIFFLLCIKDYRIQNIFIFALPSYKTLFSQIKDYALNPTAAVLLIAVYETGVFGKIRKKASVYGIILGFALLGLCLLNSLLLFGSNLAALLDYPYASAISTVTVGRLFTRLDGFSYFVYFTSCLTKITVCVFIIRYILKNCNLLLKNTNFYTN